MNKLIKLRAQHNLKQIAGEQQSVCELPHIKPRTFNHDARGRQLCYLMQLVHKQAIFAGWLDYCNSYITNHKHQAIANPYTLASI